MSIIKILMKMFDAIRCRVHCSETIAGGGREGSWSFGASGMETNISENHCWLHQTDRYSVFWPPSSENYKYSTVGTIVVSRNM